MNDFSAHVGCPAARRTVMTAVLVLLLAACGGSATQDGPIVTASEQVQADVPTLADVDDDTVVEGTEAAASDPAPPSTAGTTAPDTDPDDGADGFPARQDVPEDVPDALVTLYRLAQVVGEDPDAAGPKGSDLHKELERVLDRPERRRIDRAVERITRWDDDGEVDGEVAAAALAALDEARAATTPDEDADDEDDD